MNSFIQRAQKKLSEDAGVVSIETGMITLAVAGIALTVSELYDGAVTSVFSGITTKITAASK